MEFINTRTVYLVGGNWVQKIEEILKHRNKSIKITVCPYLNYAPTFSIALLIPKYKQNSKSQILHSDMIYTMFVWLNTNLSHVLQQRSIFYSISLNDI
jgi:hypothetical protein